MFRKLFLALAATTLFTLNVSAQTPTVDDIVNKHVAAMGGVEKLKAAKSLRLTGKMTVGPGIEAPVVIEFKRPGSTRMEITLQGLTLVQAYDGKTGWMINPFQGSKTPEAMGEDELKSAAENADWEGPLVNYKEKGNKVELVGKEAVEGTDAYKLKVTLKNGDVRYMFLDADSFLSIKDESKRSIRGTEQETESASGDYKEVDGLVFAHSVEVGAKGSSQKQKITVDKIEINPAIEDARFKMPEVKKAEGNAPAVKPESNTTESKPADKKPTEVKPPQS
ncbi:MAG: LolA family protein [Pyrinomonadaceae bacterium]